MTAFNIRKKETPLSNLAVDFIPVIKMTLEEIYIIW